MSVIPIANSSQAALDFVMRVLTEKFNADLVDTLEVAPNGAGQPFDPDGIYMPGVARWYRQSAPTRQQLQEPPHNVTGFVGPVGATFYTSPFKALTGWGAIADALLPFGVTLLVKQAPQPAVSDPLQTGQRLTDAELLIMRCLRYQGVLKHTLTKWGCRDVACRDIDPTEDIAVGGDIGSYAPDEEQTLRGLIYVEFNIYQEQGFPLQEGLPALP